MSTPGRYIAAYDISDDHERERVSRVLEGYGFRVQESVFECLLTRAMRESLLRSIEALKIESGFVQLYKLHEGAKTITIGVPPADGPDDSCTFIA